MVTFGCRVASRPMVVRSPITTHGPTTAPGPSRALAAITALGSTCGAGRGGGGWSSSTAATKARYGCATRTDGSATSGASGGRSTAAAREVPRREPAVGEKGERPRRRVLDRRHVDDLDRAVTAQLAAERARDLAELHATPLAEAPRPGPTHERRSVSLALPRGAC